MFSCIPFWLNHDQAIRYSPYNYLIAQLLLFSMLGSISKSARNTFLLSPSFIAVSYININFFVGSIVFMNGLVFGMWHIPYLGWKHVNLSMAYFNLANFLIVISFFLAKRIKLSRERLLYDVRRVGKGWLIAMGIVLIVVFSIVELDLSLLGGQGSFSILPKSLGAIIIFVVFFRDFKLVHRIMCYAGVILLFAIASFEDKRDAIFLLLPILLLESTRYPFNLNFGRALLFISGVAFLGYLIIVMSILRGYGSYRPKGFLDATSYVTDYVKSADFVPSYMNNLEISFTYFHSNNAIEYIIDDPEKLSYGQTIVKPLFILFPRNIFSRKPESIIELYTSSFSREMRKMGVSWVISFQSELFWNFHFFGALVGAAFFLFFNSAYLGIVQLIKEDEIINYVPLLYIYQQALVLYRGSGLDQYLIDIVLSFAIFAVIKIVLRIIPRRSAAPEVGT